MAYRDATAGFPMRDYGYVLCDVFTATPYSGNPLAVLPDASGLETGAMQRIAAEFNLSETAFVFPGEPPSVRIFTPRDELPFAGHPTIGTAHVLWERGALGPADAAGRYRLDEPAGPIAIERDPSPGDAGAAATALAGLLGRISGPGTHRRIIHQGLRMGRPCRLALAFDVVDDHVERVRLGGAAVTVGGGRIVAPEA